MRKYLLRGDFEAVCRNNIKCRWGKNAKFDMKKVSKRFFSLFTYMNFISLLFYEVVNKLAIEKLVCTFFSSKFVNKIHGKYKTLTADFKMEHQKNWIEEIMQ